jgi:hypothetical protein
MESREGASLLIAILRSLRRTEFVNGAVSFGVG